MSVNLVAETRDAEQLAINSPEESRLSSGETREWWEVDLIAGAAYTVNIVGDEVAGLSLYDPGLFGIYDGSLNRVPASDLQNSGRGVEYEFTVATSGTYYFAVEADNGRTGKYSVSVNTEHVDVPQDGNDTVTDDNDTIPVGNDDILATPAGAVYLNAGDSYSAAINSATDVDWFSVYLNYGTKYRFDVTGNGSGHGTLVDPQIFRVYNADLEEVMNPQDTSKFLSNNNGGDDDLEARLYFDVPEGWEGKYYLAVRASDQGQGTYRITYDVSSAFSDDGGDDDTPQTDDIGSTRETAQAIEVGTNFASTIDSADDEDAFRADLKAGITYIFYMESDGLPDPYLTGLFSSTGRRLAWENNNGGALYDARIKYTPSSDITVFVGAKANYNGGTGDYILRLYEESEGPGSGIIDDDDDDSGTDVGDTLATATTISIGQSVVSDIASASDQDAFRVTLTAGRRFQIDLRGDDTGSGSLDDPEIEGIYTASGQKLYFDTDAGVGNNARVTLDVSPVSDSVYFIVVKSEDGGTGDYTLNVTDIGAVEDTGHDDADDDTWQSAVSVDLDERVQSTIDEASDQDWYRITFTEARKYAVLVQGADTNNGTLLDPRLLDIRDSTGAVIDGTRRDNSGDLMDPRLFYDFDAATYYFGVDSADGGLGSYTFTVVESGNVPGDDYSQDGTNPGLVNANNGTGSVTGSIEVIGDADYFRSFMFEGYTYEINLTGQRSGDGTLGDPYFFGVRDSVADLYRAYDGTWDDNSGRGLESRITFTAPTSDYYFLAVGANQDTTGSYTLSVTNLGLNPNGAPTNLVFADEDDVPGGHPPEPDYSDHPDDFKAEAGERGTITVGQQLSGKIDYPTDLDYIEVELVAGQHYQIDAMTQSGALLPLADPRIVGLFDTDLVQYIGTQATGGGAGDNARLTYTAYQTGTHVIVIAGEGTDVGNYDLAVTQVNSGVGIGGILETDQLRDPEGPDDAAQNVRRAAAISVDVPEERAIDTSGDEDWLSVDLVAGRQYRIDMIGTGHGGGALSAPAILGLFLENGAEVDASAYTVTDLGNGVRIDFTPVVSQSYVIAAAAEGSATGDYRLTVLAAPDPDPSNPDDDYSASTFTWGTLAVDGTATGEIEVAGDHDWFAMALTEGYGYRVVASQASGDDGLGYPDILGVTGDGVVYLPATSDTDLGSNADVTFVAPQDGIYYLAVRGEGTATGSYDLSLADQGLMDDYSGSSTRAGSISAGQTILARADFEGDVDWFGFTAQSGAFYVFDSDSRSSALDDPRIESIIAADGTVLTQRVNGDPDNRLIFDSSYDGTAYVALRNLDGDTGSYALSMEEVTTGLGTVGDEGTSPASAAGTKYFGTIDRPGDWDVIGFELTEDTIYSVSIDPRGLVMDALATPMIGAIWAAGTTDFAYAGPAQVGGEGVQTSYTATTTGTHYIVVDSSAASGFGDYTVTVEVDEHASHDVGDTVATAGEITLGSELEASIGIPYDVDWYGVDLTGGQIYEISIRGALDNKGTIDRIAFGGVQDAGGSYISGTSSFDGAWAEGYGLLFTPDADGRYFLEAFAEGDTGSYTLSIDEWTGPADLPASTATTTEVALNGTVRSVFETNDDVDWIRADLSAGQTYVLTLESAGDPAPWAVNPLAVYDSNGNEVHSVREELLDESSVVGIAVAPDADGDYYFAVRSGYGTGYYDASLALVDTSNDVAASTATTATIATSGVNYYYGELETPSDSDWIKLTLTEATDLRIELDWLDGLWGFPDLKLNGVRDSSGALLPNTTVDDSGDLTPILIRSFDAGTYYLDVGAEGNDFGSYALEVSETTIAEDDFAASADTTGSLAVNGTAEGQVEVPGDVDWIKMVLSAGQLYTIDVSPRAEAGLVALTDSAILGVYDDTNALLPNTTNDDNGDSANARVTFHVEEAGTYFVAVSGAGDWGGYEVSLQDNGSVVQARDFAFSYDLDGAEGYETLVTEAASWWEAAIGNGLVPVTHPTIGVINDLHLIVREADLPDGQYALGTPTVLREGANGLPYLGTLLIDSTAMATLGSDAERAMVLEHEIGHVLGLGALWQQRGLIDGDKYTGAGAVSAYQSLGGTSDEIDIETHADGSNGYGWNEAEFGTEIMSAVANVTGEMPTSVVTLGALRDLGYEVDLEAADSFALIPVPVDPSNMPAFVPDPAEPVLELPDGYAPHSYSFQSFDADVLGVADALAVDGLVLLAGSSVISFIQDGSQSQRIVRLTGDFTKQTISRVEDAKGTVQTLEIFDSGVLSGTLTFAAPVAVAQVLTSNYGFDLSDANLVVADSGVDTDDAINLRDGHDAADGGLGDDSIIGGRGKDTLLGGAGDDSLLGGNQLDVLFGGSGNDTLGGGGSHDTLWGGDGNDALNGGKKHDYVDGGAGNDTITATKGDDTLRGGSGEDVVILGLASTDVTITAGADTLIFTSGKRTLDVGLDIELFKFTDGNQSLDDVLKMVTYATFTGTADPDDMQGTEAPEIIEALGGNDTITVLGGNDTVDGGEGTDQLSFASLPADDGLGSGYRLTIDMQAGTATNHDGTEVISFSGMEAIIGTEFADEITGTTNADDLAGGNGRDWFIASGGNDTMDGGGGTDTLSFLEWVPDDDSTDDIDALILDSDGTPPLGTEITGVLLDLTDASNNSGWAAGLSISSIERIVGSSYQDVIISDGASDRLRGQGGDDWFVAAAGVDSFFGGNGFDVVTYYLSDAGVDAALGTSGAAGGYAEFDSFSGIEGLIGSEFTDLLQGTDDFDWLVGLDGNDTLIGNGGDDKFLAGTGNNDVYGGEGDDTAYFALDYVSYNVLRYDDGLVQVQYGGGGPLETSEFTDVESFVFADQTRSFDDIALAIF